MTIAPPSSTAASRRPALLLVLTVPAFVAYVVLAVTTLATRTDPSSAELTPSALSDLGASWVALHVLWMAPSVLAILGLAQVAAWARLEQAAHVGRLVAVTVVLASG